MTQEMYTHCRAELEDAIESGDERRIKAAEARILTGIMECQLKTSERVKSVVGDIAKIMQDHGAMKAACLEYRTEKAERRGAAKMMAVVKYLAVVVGSGGGGAAIMKLISCAS